MAANSVLSSTITCFRKRFKLNSHKKTTHPRFIPISAPRFILISAPRFILISAPRFILISAPRFILISAPRFILISAPRFILISAPRFILISVPSIRSVPHPYPRFILTRKRSLIESSSFDSRYLWYSTPAVNAHIL